MGGHKGLVKGEFTVGIDILNGNFLVAMTLPSAAVAKTPLLLTVSVTHRICRRTGCLLRES